MYKKYLFLLILVFTVSSFGNGNSLFHIRKNQDSYLLVNTHGEASFSLGINHIQALSYPSKMELYTSKYNDSWRNAAIDIKNNLINWGFNAAGYGTPKELREIMPFMMPCQPLVQNSAYLGEKDFSYSDIFDPAIQNQILIKIKNMTSEKDNPNLIGYYWTDTPMWDLEKSKQRFGINWVEYIKQLPLNTPGRIRYEEFKKSCLVSQYPAFDEDFLGIIAKEYYQLIGKETRRLDPNHLIFGERYLMDNHPINVIREALPYIDVLSIQPNGHSFNAEYFNEMYNLTKKPIIICDHQCSFPTHQHKNTMWVQLENQEVVANNYGSYIKDAVKKPYIIGYHRCQYIDRYNHSAKKLKQGMVKEDGEAYEPHASIITSENNEVQKIFKKLRL